MSHLLTLSTNNPVYIASGLLATILTLLFVKSVISRAIRGSRPEDVLTVVAALIATAVQADGMWVFFRQVVNAPVWLCIAGFAFLELAMFVSGLRARRNIRETPENRAGLDGTAVWVIAGLSATLASTASDSVRIMLLRLIAAAVAAWLWERCLSSDRRRARTKKDERETSIHWRVTPERILVRLGLATPTEQTTTEADAHRRITHLTRAAHRLRGLRRSGAGMWRQNRAERRVHRAMDAAVRAGLAGDPPLRKLLMDQIAARYTAESLADINPPSPWVESVPADRTDYPVRSSAGSRTDRRTGPRTDRRTDRREGLRTDREASVPSIPTKTQEEVDREALIQELTADIRLFVDADEKWSPDYADLQARTGRGRSWCEKVVADAKRGLFPTEDPERAAQLLGLRTPPAIEGPANGRPYVPAGGAS